MKIVQLTPGAGGMYCGGCLRDNALVKSWRQLGHDGLLVPLYLPLRLDEPQATSDTPIFFGGINVYLQQKAALFRKLPKWMDKAFDASSLLRLAAAWTGRTRPEDLGQITVSMLKGEEGHQAKELENLVDWLKSDAKPDVVSISNLMLVGLARRIKSALGIPVVCSFQCEHTFLDALMQPYCDVAWSTLRERARDADAFISPSRYYADWMGAKLEIPAERIHVVFNGVNMDGYTVAETPPSPPVLGYFARLGPEKGLATLVEAFRQLKKRPGLEALKLRAGGSLSSGDEPFVKELEDGLRKEGLGDDVEFVPNASRKRKQEFLRSLSVFSVPTTYGEAFGLYVLESLASGVPVVQPRHAAFPELIEATGGGVLCEPDDPKSLADVVEPLLKNPDHARALGKTGREAVVSRFNAERMGRDIAEVMKGLVTEPARP